MKQILIYISKKIHGLNFQTPSVLLALLVLNQSVIVQWLSNSEQDLAGYKVYYGKTSRSYSNSISAGFSTKCSITNLQPGYEYFFAVTAYDTAGNESQLSEEVSILIEDNENVVTANDKNAYNFPNPFNPEIQITQIRYHLLNSETVTITIFDVGGNEIRTLLKNVLKSPGEHTEDTWDGKDKNGNLVSNGIYYANVSAQSIDHYITIAITR